MFDHYMDVMNSELWDQEETHLPVVPQHNNPWLYGAYNCLEMAMQGMLDRNRAVIEMLESSVKRFIYKTRTGFGTFTRWKDGRGGTTSHDEVLGRLAFSREFAREFVWYMVVRFGFFMGWKPRNWLYRYIFLMPFALHRAGFPVIFGRLWWSLYLVIDAKTQKKDTPNCIAFIKIQVMRTMGELFICRQAYNYWARTLNKKGVSPELIFSKHYLTECPSMALMARTSIDLIA